MDIRRIIMDNNYEQRTIRTADELLTQEWRPKMSVVPRYIDGFGWTRESVFLGLYEWVTIKSELLTFDECEILI